MDTETYLKQLNEFSHDEAQFRKKCGHVSLLEYRVLDLIFDEPLCLKNISQSRGVAPQAIGRVCSRLEKRGIVNIDTDDRDGRAKRVSLTPVGIAIHGKGSEALEEIIERYQ